MSTSQRNKNQVNLAKTSLIVTGVATGILSVTYPQLNLNLGQATAQTIPQRPNTVVIMTDDLSRNELNVALNRGWMPNLKTHVINRGTTFTRSFASNPLCCPSRSTFLTGQYSHNHDVVNNKPPTGGVTQLRDDSTLATWLKRRGYRTCLIGKYLNGYGLNRISGDPSDDPTYIPPGWDNWQALSGSFTEVYNYRVNDNGTIVNYGADPATPPSEYQTDVLARRSVSFIDASEARDSTPFFLLITPSAPHLEPGGKAIRPAPRHQGTASDVLLPRPPSFNEQDISDKPVWLRNKIPRLSSEEIADFQTAYRSKLESLRAVDDLIGSVVSALGQNGELDNTVLIFTSDNGYLFGEHRLTAKTHVYEESIRVPLFIRTPGLPKQTISRFVLNNDLAPTIADFADATPDIPVDGRSLIPLLREPSRANWRKRFLVERSRDVIDPSDPPDLAEFRKESPTYAAVRTGSLDTATPNQLYARYPGGSQEFYDLAIDPYQLQSLDDEVGLRQQQIEILQARLANLKVCSGQSCRVLEDN